MKKLLMVALAMTLLLSVVALAQYQRHDREGRPGERVGRISGVIADLERRTDEFKQALGHAMERAEMRGSGRADRLNDDARRLERAMNRLRDSWNRDHDPERSRRNAAMAISAGRDINRTLAHHRARSFIQREWDAIRAELNRLAEAFGEPRIRW